MGGYPPDGVSYGLDSPTLIGVYHRADYPKGWVPTANSRIPTRRGILWVGYPASNGEIPTWRSILRNGYLPLIGGFPPVGVSYGLVNPPLTGVYPPLG